MHLYPNLQDVINIILPQLKEMATITLSSMDGRLIQIHTLSETSPSLSVKQFIPGIYLMKISSSEGTVTWKIIKDQQAHQLKVNGRTITLQTNP